MASKCPTCGAPVRVTPIKEGPLRIDVLSFDAQAGSISEQEMMPAPRRHPMHILYLGMDEDGVPLRAFRSDGEKLHTWLGKTPGSKHTIIILEED